MTRQEHLEWAKERALEYVDRARKEATRQNWAGVRKELADAYASMGSDLGKHPDLANHKGIELGIMLIMMPNSPYLEDPDEMERFIKGFN
jgi:hypothetical protein